MVNGKATITQTIVQVAGQGSGVAVEGEDGVGVAGGSQAVSIIEAGAAEFLGVFGEAGAVALVYGEDGQGLEALVTGAGVLGGPVAKAGLDVLDEIVQADVGADDVMARAEFIGDSLEDEGLAVAVAAPEGEDATGVGNELAGHGDHPGGAYAVGGDVVEGKGQLLGEQAGDLSQAGDPGSAVDAGGIWAGNHNRLV